MTRLSTVAVVAATATLAKQASSATDFGMQTAPKPSPAKDSTRDGGGEEEVVYLGCFYDSSNDRVLGGKVASSADMTIAVSRNLIQDFFRNTPKCHIFIFAFRMAVCLSLCFFLLSLPLSLSRPLSLHPSIVCLV